ncbi:MAG: glycosyltransferase family 4 protein [Mobilicoccus sp.]|nr:glycosyltransferase family 4 protein [Mobilicoccus sp.]
MRILWLAPWFSTLSVAWANGLRNLGHEVVVVTTDSHFDAPEPHARDIVLSHKWRTRPGAVEFIGAARQVRSFAAQVVVSEIGRDPRFLALLPRRVPIVTTTHDARPHDTANRTPLMRRVAAATLRSRTDLEVVFSEHVKLALGSRGHPVTVVPLTSEMPESQTPHFVPAKGRRDFLVVGRLSQYKNVPSILTAFEMHQNSPSYQGDRLVLFGGGDPGCEIPADVEWVRGRYSFADLAPRLASAKASICLYSAGSQSGVQVLSAQCGVRTVVSDVGGLGEYLPHGEVALSPHDHDALADAFGMLADPVRAAHDGALHRELYESTFSNAATAKVWDAALSAVAAV